MDITLFDYPLPKDLIAVHPPARRDGGRLMALRGDAVSHHRIPDLPDLLPDDCLVVINDSKVFPARLFAKRPTGGRVEVLLVRLERADADSCTWRALCKANKPVRQGDVLHFDAVQAAVTGIDEDGARQLTFASPAEAVWHLVHARGTIPLPPYLGRDPDPDDAERYQTVYARDEGSVAAPTAGLHLTPALLDRLRTGRRDVVSVTLHVGPGTFRPITAKDTDAHVMDEEHYSISETSAAAIEAARAAGRPIAAVGTTTVRALESCAAATGGRVEPGTYTTRLFIQPPYDFRVVDILMTNFHLPKSTLLCLVCALGGIEPVMNAYHQAVRHRYRFYSYGDAMLVWRRR